MEGVMQLSVSSDVKHNELCLYLLDKLAEHVGSYLVANLTVVGNIILPFLQGNNGVKIRTYAVQAVCSILHELPENATKNYENSSSNNNSTANSNSSGDNGINNAMTKVLVNSLQHISDIINNSINSNEGTNDEAYVHDMLVCINRLSKNKNEFFVLSWEGFFQSIIALCNSSEVEINSKILALEIWINLLTGDNSSSYCSNENSRKECLMVSNYLPLFVYLCFLLFFTFFIFTHVFFIYFSYCFFFASVD